jgi:hypothetical protein
MGRVLTGSDPVASTIFRKKSFSIPDVFSLQTQFNKSADVAESFLQIAATSFLGKRHVSAHKTGVADHSEKAVIHCRLTLSRSSTLMSVFGQLVGFGLGSFQRELPLTSLHKGINVMVFLVRSGPSKTESTVDSGPKKWRRITSDIRPDLERALPVTFQQHDSRLLLPATFPKSRDK